MSRNGEFTGLVDVINDTAYDEVHPTYMLILARSGDWEKLKGNNSVIREVQTRDYKAIFYKVADNVYYTYCNGLPDVISDAIYKLLEHNHFFLSKICPVYV
mgnify:FL=1|jgi:hypothetical protein